ncbi:WhiB family transcriptional regulator [Corynebacterium atypicum]|uniref:Transcriptional regulator WhiB n=1 Tax=Corynebacterium atypicum TaxID=191610 RepID=A0ABN4DEC3_9CORY|nr:WhiB family transcriptional regulator [Corynebacterium atypicum]AIG63539.1 WhiB family transcriptional regulator [Corynebacterium atypicum]
MTTATPDLFLGTEAGKTPTEAVQDRGTWVTRAKCRGLDPEALFVKGARQRQAATFCQGCPVRAMCLADALDNGIEFGVWGGLTERQRRALLRKNPAVRCWADYLAEGGELFGI